MQTMLQRAKARRAEDGEGGFTLIELLIVVVVLGILAAIVVFAVQNLTSESAKSTCKSDAKSVEVALEASKAQSASSAYPTLSASTQKVDASMTSLVGTYLRTAPNAQRYGFFLKDADGASPFVSDGKVYVDDTPATAPAFATWAADTKDFATGTACDAVQ